MMKKCPKCELNWIEDSKEMCDICSQSYGLDNVSKKHPQYEDKNTRLIRHTHGKILNNWQLNGQKFCVNIKGYEEYLVQRGYKVYTPSGADSTAKHYPNAVERICEEENISFIELFDNIQGYVALYDFDGAKRDLGMIGHRTWINALKRLSDFNDYIHTIE